MPATQSVQAEASGDELHLPAAQVVQEEDAAAEYSPASREDHVDSLVAPVEELHFPAAQVSQSEFEAATSVCGSYGFIITLQHED